MEFKVFKLINKKKSTIGFDYMIMGYHRIHSTQYVVNQTKDGRDLVKTFYDYLHECWSIGDEVSYEWYNEDDIQDVWEHYMYIATFTGINEAIDYCKVAREIERNE